MDRVKNRLTEENIDKELVKLGYPKIFTVDYDDYDNYDYDNWRLRIMLFWIGFVQEKVME